MKESSVSKGLNEPEARERLLRFGTNELPSAEKESSLKKIARLFKEPMLALLVGSAAVYFLIGETKESVLLGLSVFVVIGISYYEQIKSEKALDALRELSSPRALVIREGVEKRVPARELVPGDLIALHEGDRVPADAVLVHADHLAVDESLLTGESLPVVKQSGVANPDRVFSSTLIVAGRARAIVTKTGAATEVGRIGTSLGQAVNPGKMHLSAEIRRVVKIFGILGVAVCSTFVFFYGFFRGDWLQAVLGGLATAMAMLPEEFPMILTIFLALGSWRLASAQVLVRRPESIERLGGISALCVDKTGTLTENRMTVSAIFDGQSWHRKTPDQTALDGKSAEVIKYGVLASPKNPFDPMEKELYRVRESCKLQGQSDDWVFEREYPLSPELFATTNVFRDRSRRGILIAAVKGAPESVLSMCRLTPEERARVLSAVKEKAEEGLRVLGVASAEIAGAESIPENQRDIEFDFLGLIAFADPLRKEVPAAVALCRNAGIRVLMMTGDFAETARRIAAETGISTPSAVLTGEEVEKADEPTLRRLVRETNVFARVRPEQKLRIVQALKADGFVVGMTGDGVNDAPSLKQSDVGIAMGGRGTDVARESADLVLVDDNFASIVSGIERGRAIFSNIRSAMAFITSIHVPIAGLALLPVFFGWPLILMPAHIVFLEMLIDPSCSLIFESRPGDVGIMKQPPRSLSRRLFGRRDLIRSLVQGGLILLGSVLIFSFIFLRAGEIERARAASFMTLVLSNIGLILADFSNGDFGRIWSIFRGKTNAIILTGALFLLGAVLAFDPLLAIFKFTTPGILDMAFALAWAIGSFVLISVWNRLAG